MMDDVDYASLRDDIQKHGQLVPIKMLNGQVIDGRNRLRACIELGLKPLTEDVPSEVEPVAFVLSHNLERRHLNTSQRAMVAAKIATYEHGGNRKSNDQGANLPLEKAAEKMGVSKRSASDAKQVLKNAEPEIVEAVTNGDMAVSKAAKQSKPRSPAPPREGTENFNSVDDDKKEEIAGNAVKEFKKLWNKCDPTGKRAIRVWLDENYLEG